MILGPSIERLVRDALQEDLEGGDLTTEATVSPSATAVAHAVARETLIVCGWPLFEATFAALDASLMITRHAGEGARLEPGARLWTVSGNARAILMAERTALNFVQRLSGIATLTRRFVDALPAGSKARIADTRKTTPLLRNVERYAVRIGGGFNHRNNLGSAVLIKDNHIAAAGGIELAIESARRTAPHTARIEVEVDSLEQVRRALDAGPDIILLDNFTDPEVARAIDLIAGRARVEVSGGIIESRVERLARLGVDVISVGALTHSAKAADIGLDFE